MTGLDLETFLRLLRVDAGAWTSLGVVVGVLGLLAWMDHLSHIADDHTQTTKEQQR